MNDALDEPSDHQRHFVRTRAKLSSAFAKSTDSFVPPNVREIQLQHADPRQHARKKQHLAAAAAVVRTITAHKHPQRDRKSFCICMLFFFEALAAHRRKRKI
eukprot:10673-Heterococcus_DN1.PRE.2